jgi:hypothetical protein
MVSMACAADRFAKNVEDKAARRFPVFSRFRREP